MPRSYRHIKQYKNKMLKKSYKVYPYGNGQNIVYTKDITENKWNIIGNNYSK